MNGRLPTQGALPVANLRASSLHAIHRLVQRRGADTIPLHVGEPHLRMPPGVKQAYVRALRDGQTQYTDAPGLLALREALSERLAHNGKPSPDRVFITPGSCQAIAAVLQSIATPGGVAVLPRVHWPIHLQQVLIAGLTPRFVSLSGDERSVVRGLEEAYDPNTCVIIINSPANPTGTVLSQVAVTNIHDWAARHGIWLISDEAYEDFTYDESAPGAASFDAELPETERVVFSVHTFSKGYSMTGCRLGYVTAPSSAAGERLARVQEATLLSPSTPVQHAGLAALGERQFLTAHHEYVQVTRDAVTASLSQSGLIWQYPAGGWYLLLDLSAYTMDTDGLCRELLEKTGVAFAPGRDFFPPDDNTGNSLVRLTLCQQRDLTVEGVRLLRDYLQSLQ